MMYVLHCAPFDNAGLISAFCWGGEREQMCNIQILGGGGQCMGGGVSANEERTLGENMSTKR